MLIGRKSLFLILNQQIYIDHLRAKKVNVPASLWQQWKLLLAAFYLRFQNLILGSFQYILFSKKNSPEKILIFRTGSLGDSICATPTLAAIRMQYPASHITLLTNAGKRTLVSPQNVISRNLYDDLIDYLGVGPYALLKILKKGKFDYVVQLPQVDAPFLSLLRDLFFFRLICRSGWGWKVSRVLLFKKLIEKQVLYRSESERLLFLAQENGIKQVDNRFYLNSNDDDQRVADEYFEQNNLPVNKTIVVAVGANSVKNRWPIENFGEVINYFQPHYSILLVGGKEDNELVERFAGIPGVYNCCGIFTPMQSAALIKKARVALSNDTGPLHLSYAVGTPVIGLFASRDFYGKWFPPETSLHKVLRTPDVPCSLCFFAACSNNICMQAIKPGTVIAAIEEFLNPGN